MTRITRATTLLTLAAAAGCADLLGPRPDNAPYRAIQIDSRVTQAFTGFGLDLFAELIAEEPEENLFISPTSAALALAMTYNGAAGETREGMALALGVSGLSLEDLNDANRTWLAALRETQDPRVELAVANSIWAREGSPFLPAFYDRNRTYYDAEVRELPFDDGALEIINGWVRTNTRDKIEKILDEIDPDAVMFLINAVYFNGRWTYRFDKAQSKPHPFTRQDGSVVQVQMMSQRATVPYRHGDGFQMVALPYGNGRFSMVLAVPHPGRSLEDLYAQLTPQAWNSWLDGMEETPVDVLLPRFRMESDKFLNRPLMQLGMTDAFDPWRANFSELTPEQVYIAFVRQKAFVEVDEEGTEAAAVTAVGMQLVCAGCGPVYPVVQLDRPFFFAIQDNATGTVLFLGQVMDPTAG